MTLFAQRAAAIAPDFTLDEGNARWVADVCGVAGPDGAVARGAGIDLAPYRRFDDDCHRARAALGDEAFEEARTQGAQLTPPRALSYALGEKRHAKFRPDRPGQLRVSSPGVTSRSPSWWRKVCLTKRSRRRW
jgi:hypothetical protein